MESDPAPETAVLLRPGAESTDAADLDAEGETIDAGDTATYHVVVANASGGVGAHDFHIDIDDPTHATAREVSVRGDPSDATTDTTLVDDGQAVNVTAALTDTDDTGSVTVATVTLRGHAVGTTDIGLRVDALGTEAGTAYNVTAVNGTSITVESDYHGGSTDDADDADDADEFVEEVTRDEISREKYGVDFADLGSETAGAVQAIYNRQPFPDDTGPGEIQTRNELSNDRYGTDFDELSRENAIEVQNDYDAQFGPLPTGPAHSRDDISQAKYDTDFADLGADRAGKVQAIYNRQPFPDGTSPGEIRTRDEITNDRYFEDFADLSRQTAIDVQNDYDAQFGDGDE